MSYYDDSVETFEHLHLLLLTFVALISFYWQALVTEERLIPALNVISKWFELSDDVAGATLMAAGSSAPELFVALVSTFLAQSSLGLGTVAGSAVFNQLFIPAAAILAAKNNSLVLDPIFLCRDVIFYLLSLTIMLVVLKGRKPVNDDGIDHVCINSLDGVMMMSCYIVYVLVCSKYDIIIHSLKIKQNRSSEGEGRKIHYQVDKYALPLERDISFSEVKAMPFLRSCGGLEPSQNFHRIDSICHQSEMIPPITVLAELYCGSSTEEDDLEGVYGGMTSIRTKSQFFFFHNFTPALKEIDGINDVEELGNILSFHLWHRSSFYDKTKIDMHAWHLRWFSFLDTGRISSVSTRTINAHNAAEKTTLPYYNSFQTDEARLLIKIQTPSGDIILLAPSDAIFKLAVSKFEEYMGLQSNCTAEASTFAAFDLHHTKLITFPSSASKYQIFIHILTYPVKLIVHTFIPDVRAGTSISPLLKAVFASIMSIVFLIISSYIMVLSLESLARWLNIPDTVVGATISAAGTSWPSCIASQVAASLGLGNMAVGNVFGSNSFNILVALGFPWLLYTIWYGKEYTEIPVDGMNESMIAMFGSFFAFVFIVLTSGFKLRLWHANIFLFLYLGYVIWIFLQAT